MDLRVPRSGSDRGRGGGLLRSPCASVNGAFLAYRLLSCTHARSVSVDADVHVDWHAQASRQLCY
eukprot:2498111-Prymnesium_polylepis.1